ncbi:MAG TPA: DUF5947 family protein, partial [Patescibacteria group bacterium]|nr:DUF5947 family protein [Patescibacteria group bacterium]
MKSSSITGAESAFAILRRLARPGLELEQCEFCSNRIPAQHRHLFEPATRKIICACDACALRFENVVGRWKLIPRDTRFLTDVRISQAQWDSLALPINLAFFFQSTVANRVVAMYPSPAGATESLLPLGDWEALVSANRGLARLQPDVEALLVNRLGSVPGYWIAPIDTCFELVGLIRIHWRGFSGGDRVWRAVGDFFAKLEPQS